MVTDVPEFPAVGVMLAMAGRNTPNHELLAELERVPAVTTTYPLLTPFGTVTLMLVLLQLEIVAD